MKQGKRLTKRQKIALKMINLNPDNWLYNRVEPDGFWIVHRFINTTRKIYY